jgi:hypothetical protein
MERSLAVEQAATNSEPAARSKLAVVSHLPGEMWVL